MPRHGHWLRLVGRAAFSLLLASCASLPPTARPMPPSDAQRALSAWVAHGYPEGRCREALSLLRVVVVPRTAELCAREASGCQFYRRTGFMGTGTRYPVIAMRADSVSPALLAHELVHLLERCSGFDGQSRHWHKLRPVEAAIAEVL